MAAFCLYAPMPAFATTTQCSGFTDCETSPYNDHGWGAHYTSSYWGQFNGDNCTNYVAYYEQTVRGMSPTRPSWLTVGGNADAWASEASAAGITVNNTPAVGAVAQWGDYGWNVNTGHIGIVESVSNNNTTIVVSWDTYPGGPYKWVQINSTDANTSTNVGWPNNFIYLGGVTAGSSSSHYQPLSGDFNNDGETDIAMRDSVDGTWHVEYGPNYTSGVGIAWAAGSNYQPFVGDFNHDGYRDIGLRDSSDGSLHIEFGPGFTTGAGYSWAAGSNYRAFAGDFNNDGYTDIGIRDSVDGSWHLLYAPNFNTGIGWSWTSGAGASYWPIVGDFNHDGYEDIGLYDQTGGIFHFEYGPSYSTVGAYTWVAGSNYQPFVGDFNEDGYTDIGLRDSSIGMWYFKLGSNYASNQSTLQWVAG